MSNSLEQKISELLDNELTSKDQENLLKWFKQDSGIKQTMGRYSLIGDAMRKNLPNDVKHNLASRISKAIESEPTLLFPNTSSLNKSESLNPPRSLEPVSDSVALPRKSSRSSAVGLATAASFAIASVIGYVVLTDQIETKNDLLVSDNVLAKQELMPINTQGKNSLDSITLQVNAPSVLVDSAPSIVAKSSGNTPEAFTISSRSTPLVVIRELDQESEWMRLNDDGGVRVEQFQNNANVDGVQRFPQSKMPYGQVVRYGAQWSSQ